MTASLNIEQRPFSLDDKYQVEEGTIYLSGLQGLVRVLLDQHRADRRRGLRTGGIVSGYPGSPLGGFDIELERRQKLLVENDVFHIPGLNEELAATAVFGGQLMQDIPDPRYDGVFGMWYGKAPGVDRAIDAFRHGNFRGIARNGGVVAVAGDDPIAKSSINPSDSLGVLRDVMMPTLFPADVQDLLDLGQHAFMLSRASRLGVGLKLVTDVADSAATVLVSPDRITPMMPSEDGFDSSALEFVPNRTGKLSRDKEYGLTQVRLPLAQLYGRLNHLNRVIGSSSQGRIGIIAAGKDYLDLVEAMRQLGMDPAQPERHGFRVLKLGMVYPLDDEELRHFAKGLDQIVVLEEKRSYIEPLTKSALYGIADCPVVMGKVDMEQRELVPAYGEIDTELVARILAPLADKLAGGEAYTERLLRLTRRPSRIPITTTVRTGYFCSGCPHTTSLKAPDGSIVGGGIGCHTMAIAQNRDDFGKIIGFTQMGGEGAQWTGLTPFSGTEHFFQNLGDGTFAHSGSLAIRFAIAAKTNVTYKILYNSAVAMTGGQDATGGMKVPEMVRMLEAEGVKQIVITTDDVVKYRRVKLPKIVSVRSRAEILEVQTELAEVPGVTVLLHDERCAAEERRDRKRGTIPTPKEHVFINERVCEGCGDCGEKSSCLSVIPVETELGRKTKIHQSSCNFDFSCLEGDCPSFLTVTSSGKRRKSTGPRSSPTVVLDDPNFIVPKDHFELYMIGIGGTGVITVNQILAVAAFLDNRSVRVLDQFGGSQKAGPVVSHLKISRDLGERSGSVANGSADALLIFDTLGATEAKNLGRANPDSTVAIVSTDETPTGKMITNIGMKLPPFDSLSRAIDANTRAEFNVYMDTQTLAEDLFDDHMAANLLLVGVAYQRGAIPLSSQVIEEAIRLNKVSVEMNLAAFRWGRVAVARPDVLEAEIAGVAPPPREISSSSIVISGVPESARELVAARAADLEVYQNTAYSERYLKVVRQVAEAEIAGVPGHDELTKAVATYLYKLMAYKDEYEVARLHLDAAAKAAIAAEFGPDAKVSWRLHPPFLRSMGMKRKITLGPWFAPVFKALRAMRRVRGSALDPFGHTAIRKTERLLIDEYCKTLDSLLAHLTTENHDLGVEIAVLPDMIRGYEHIKMANVENYEARRTTLLEAWHTGDAGLGQVAG
jgi:indolepyruvate ferredoxin oxidoreductase